jgi:glyceraldehyde 3-phosphate dehydrogenase
MLKVGLNGYGRIGRMVHRISLQRTDVSVVAINARSEDAKMRAHLLKYDSIHGPLLNNVRAEGENKILVDDQTVMCIATKDAGNIAWSDHDVDVVIECTGKAKEYDMAARHLNGGAKKVVVSAPMKDDTPVFVLGVNEGDLKPDMNVVSNASCTTNCIAPPIKLIHEKWGLANVSVSSIHAVTHSQNLLDNSGRDLRRARSALMSIIPTTTGAVSVLGKIMPELAEKMDGIAYRVPILNSSLSDIVMHLEKDVTKEELNDFFKQKAKESYFDPILDVAEEPLVSIDFRGNSHSSIVDLELTQVINKRYVKLFTWYDNEWGYANRLVDLAELVGKKI